MAEVHGHQRIPATGASAPATRRVATFDPGPGRWRSHARALDAALRLLRPDLAALRAAPTRIVAGLGDATTRDQFVRRTTNALVAKLGLPVVAFPGGHTGFISEPQAFADALRKALDDGSSQSDLAAPARAPA